VLVVVVRNRALIYGWQHAEHSKYQWSGRSETSAHLWMIS
jgi:hypothetical protein